MKEFLSERESLVKVIQLVDSRHEPTAQDVQMYDYLKHYGLSGVVVATKSDKIKRSQLAKQTAMIRKTINEKSKVSHDVSFTVIPFSGTSKAGREDLYNILDGFLTEGEAVL